jgi:hypothetical protein
VLGAGVSNAVYREFLFGRGSGEWSEFQSQSFDSPGRLCSRCRRKRSGHFVPNGLSCDRTQQVLDFTESDSADRHYS